MVHGLGITLPKGREKMHVLLLVAYIQDLLHILKEKISIGYASIIEILHIMILEPASSAYNDSSLSVW